MSQHNLEIAISNLAFLIEKQLVQIGKKIFNSQNLVNLSEYYDNYGCGNFLLNLDIKLFYVSLYKGAKTYLDLLLLRKSVNLDEYYLCRSRGTPLLCALAIGDYSLATAIAENSLPFHSQMEYEDDYQSYSLLPLLYSCIENSEAIAKGLEIFENTLEGDPSARLDSVKAIYEKDEKLFNESMLLLIEQWRESVKKKRRSDKIEPMYDKTSANIFVEGIALVRLARQNGLDSDLSYSFIPDEILMHSIKEFPVQFSLSND